LIDGISLIYGIGIGAIERELAARRIKGREIGCVALHVDGRGVARESSLQIFNVYFVQLV